jgi:hypothetical protein
MTESIKRWTPRRKAAVILSVRHGEIRLSEALEYYQISEEEYISWLNAYDKHGWPGLRVSKLGLYRKTTKDQREREHMTGRPLNPATTPRVLRFLKRIAQNGGSLARSYGTDIGRLEQDAHTYCKRHRLAEFRDGSWHLTDDGWKAARGQSIDYT